MRLRRFDVVGQLRQHGDAAGDMEAADATGRPAARNGRARSTARGNWLDCTPTSPISARPPARRIMRMICCGCTRRLVSS